MMAKEKTEQLERNLLTLDQKTDICTEAAISKKAYDLVVLDLRKLSSITDYFFTQHFLKFLFFIYYIF